MKNVLITGAGGALGKACVLEFSKKGFQVITILSPGKKLDYNVSPPVSVYNANLMAEESTNSTVDQIISSHKTIDVALLLVGGFAMGSISETDGAAIKKMIGLNFDTAYYTARNLFARMTQQPSGGRLVFIGAKPALTSSAGKNLVAYTLSKTLIFKLAELLNAEGSNKNVMATVVVPSIIDSEANRKAMPKANPADWVTPQQIAEVISFATSEKGNPLRETVLKIYGRS